MPRRLAQRLLVLVLLVAVAESTFAADKRFAVLYFEDDSGFDAPSGCGCLPIGFLGRIFGRSQGLRERWNLEVGFQDMLVTTIDDAYGYEAVSPEELDRALNELDFDRKDLQKEGARRELAERLDLTAMFVGKIETFRQERARGVAQRDITGQITTGVSGASGTVGVTGAIYRVDVDIDFDVYGPRGAELLTTAVEAADMYSSGTVQSGPLAASIADEGAAAYIGSQEIITPGDLPPVVGPKTLDRVKFGVVGWDRPEQAGLPPNFRRTLFGRVTQKAMDNIIAQVRERIGPPAPEEAESEPAEREMLIGKIAFVDAETREIYINLGLSDRMEAGDKLRVYREGVEIVDPDTGEALGATETEVGLVEVAEVMRPKLSRAVVISGEALKDDVVKFTPEAAETDADNEE